MRNLLPCVPFFIISGFLFVGVHRILASLQVEREKKNREKEEQAQTPNKREKMAESVGYFAGGRIATDSMLNANNQRVSSTLDCPIHS
jgi:hypothetical protein